MRILLNEKAVVALTALQERFRNENPDTEPSVSLLLEKLILCLNKELSVEQIKIYASYVISPKLKRKRMRERLSQLADQVNEEDFNKLERRLKKLESIASNQPKINSILAEKA